MSKAFLGSASAVSLIHLCGVIIADSGGGIEQDGQQILLHVADLRGVFLHTVHDKPDVFAIQFQKSGAHDLMGKVAACNPSSLFTVHRVQQIPLFLFFEKGQLIGRIERDFPFIDHIQQFGNQLRQADIALNLISALTNLLGQNIPRLLSI